MTTFIKYNAHCITPNVTSVWLSGPKTACRERIYYQPEFWQGVLPKLKALYFTAILPELSSPLGVTAMREPTDSFEKD